MEIEVQKNVSFLQARDPSIVAGHIVLNKKVRLNLADKFSTTSVSEPTKIEVKDEYDNHLKVFLRIKGGVTFDETLYKIDDKILICKIPKGSRAAKNARDGELVTKKYTFTRIFGPDSRQAELFNYIVKPKILDFINGHNSTLMTYGTTSAGKTFTVVGCAEEPGILPRALEYLFRTLPQLKERTSIKPTPSGKVQLLNESLQKDELRKHLEIVNSAMTQTERNEHVKTYRAMQSRLSSEPVATIDTDLRNVTLGIWVSFAEIYNEYIYDLLQPSPARGHQRPKLKLGNSNGQTYIKDLTNVYVTNGIDAFTLLQYGLHNLNYASTALNTHSSRSHCIFTIKLVQRHNFDDNICISSFNFCDLAGSERSKKTQNVGERLVESNNINASLLVLGRCISNIRTVQQNNRETNFVPPFRESKLTQLFQKALTGQEDISMIVNISPTMHLFDETNHVLNFSAIAREIICEEPPKVEPPRSHQHHAEYIEKRLSMLQMRPDSTVDNEELNRLNDIIGKLTAELEWVKLDAAEELNEARTYLIDGTGSSQENCPGSPDTGYTKLLQEEKDRYKQKIENLKIEHKQEIEKLKTKYEMDNSNDSDIIVIEDEDVEELKEEIRLLKETLETMQYKHDIMKTKSDADMSLLKKTLEDARECNNCLMFEIQDLKNGISDLKQENFSLKEKLHEQNSLLEKYMVSYRENTELLESLHEEKYIPSKDMDDNKEDNINALNINMSEPIPLTSPANNSLQHILQELRKS